MEPEVYEAIVGDVKDQIRRWQDDGLEPIDTPFRAHTWAWVGRDAGVFLCDVRCIRALPEFRSKIAKDISSWVKHRQSKSRSG